MRRLLAMGMVFASGVVTPCFAGQQQPYTRLQNGLFIGMASSYNSVKIDQEISGMEFSSLFLGGSLVALGEAGGSANPYHKTLSTLAPKAELGYLYRRYASSSWLIGIKAIYQYLNLTFTEGTLTSFPSSIYTITNGSSDTFSGHLSISSSQIHIDHALSMMPVFGYFVNDSSIYLGLGPMILTKVHKLYQVAGISHINGATSNAAGGLPTLSTSQWMWGAVVELGWIYPFTSTWFLDAGYSYAVTKKTASKNSTLFSHPLITTSGLFAEEGIASLKIEQQATLQSFIISLNKVL